jgi:hypothetical protein
MLKNHKEQEWIASIYEGAELRITVGILKCLQGYKIVFQHINGCTGFLAEYEETREDAIRSIESIESTSEPFETWEWFKESDCPVCQ